MMIKEWTKPSITDICIKDTLEYPHCTFSKHAPFWATCPQGYTEYPGDCGFAIEAEDGSPDKCDRCSTS